MPMCGNFTLGRLFDSIFAHFSFNVEKLILWKSFLANFCSFYIEIVFSWKKEKQFKSFWFFFKNL